MKVKLHKYFNENINEIMYCINAHYRQYSHYAY
jgi:hypothetical protein